MSAQGSLAVHTCKPVYAHPWAGSMGTIELEAFPLHIALDEQVEAQTGKAISLRVMYELLQSGVGLRSEAPREQTLGPLCLPGPDQLLFSLLTSSGVMF